MSETIDVVNEKNQIIGVATRDEIYKRRLSHRIVHILVRNKAGKILLQLRDRHLSFAPGCWSTSAGGHVLSGETIDQAAKRELMEELGITADIGQPAMRWYDGQGGLKKILAVYSIEHDGPFKPEAGAIERIEFFSLNEIKNMINRNEKFHPELVFLVNEVL